MTYLALFLLVLDLTGSTAAIALMSILVALPPVTVGLFAGAWADRHDRRRIMIASDTPAGGRRAGHGPRRARAGPCRSLFVLACRPGGHRHLLLARPDGDGPARRPRGGPARRQLAGPGDAHGRGRRSGPAVTGVIAGDRPASRGPSSSSTPATFLVSVVLVLGIAARARQPRRRRPPPRRRPRAWAARSPTACGSSAARVRWSPRSAACPSSMLGVGAINVLFIPFLVNDLGASPAWAGPLEARPDARR